MCYLADSELYFNFSLVVILVFFVGILGNGNLDRNLGVQLFSFELFDIVGCLEKIKEFGILVRVGEIICEAACLEKIGKCGLIIVERRLVTALVLRIAAFGGCGSLGVSLVLCVAVVIGLLFVLFVGIDEIVDDLYRCVIIYVCARNAVDRDFENGNDIAE